MSGAMRLYNGTRLIDCHLVDTYPNKYHLLPRSIESLKVKDWDAFKENSFNNVFKGENWWTHIITINDRYDTCSFEYSANIETDDVVVRLTTYNGKKTYDLPEFYKVEYIEDQTQMELQAHVIKWLNKMIDNGVLCF